LHINFKDLTPHKEAIMKKGYWIGGGILAICLVFWVTTVTAQGIRTMQVGKGGARVTAIDGSAQVRIGGQGAPRALRVGEHLAGADEVATGSRSRIEMALPDGSRIRFSENTRFTLLEVEPGSYRRVRSIRVNVIVGRVWAKVARAIGARGRFEVIAENSVAGVRGTVYRVDVNEDKSNLIRVYDGTVHVSGSAEAPTKPPAPAVIGPPTKVEGPKSIPGPRVVSMEEWVYILKSMQQIVVRPDGSADEPKDFAPEEDRDPWVDWNRARDQEADREGGADAAPQPRGGVPCEN